MRLSKCRLLQKVSTLYIDSKAVNYSKYVILTFSSLFIAFLGSVYVNVMHMALTPKP